MSVLVTGANGHIGRRLLRGRPDMRAVVRSERAAAALGDHADTRIVDYADLGGLTEACAGCDAVVHLVGIVRESARASYRDAHENAARTLVRAAGNAGVRRIVYLSILGAHPGSANACFASRANTETLLAAAGIPTVVLRVPMVLGEDDFASRALFRSARAARRAALAIRAESREQPIYAGDVVDAILAALDVEPAPGVLELAGPESLSRRDLIAAAAAFDATETVRVISLPLWLGYAAAWTLKRFLPDPPLTPDMLGVLDHDDDIDPWPSATTLGIGLTSLADTLRLVGRASLGG